MRPRAQLLLTSAVCILCGCDKKTTPKPDPPAPRRNAAESLGFAAESTEGYMQKPPAAEPASAAPVPSSPPPPTATNGATKPKAAPSAAAAAIRHTLTAKDGRKVEADLLARNEREVKFRRRADAVEFTFPLEKLSEADQTFIRESTLPELAAR